MAAAPRDSGRTAEGLRPIPALIPGFTGSRLDRADPIRQDAAAFADAVADPGARLLALTDMMPDADAEGRLVWTAMPDPPGDAALILLGLDDGAPRFVALSGAGAGPPFRSPALMTLLDRLAPGEAATYAAARSLLDWHGRHGFCANCGHRTALFRAGWGRRCSNCGAEHFPRVDPVVIMIAEHDGRALVARQAAWPAGRYSALAGFLEPGESIEEAVAREIREESGLTVRDVRYVASQPWPFPSSLMIACIATAADDRLTLDHHELEAAMWVTRDEVHAALAGAPGARFGCPPPYAIAHTLLAAWAGRDG